MFKVYTTYFAEEQKIYLYFSEEELTTEKDIEEGINVFINIETKEIEKLHLFLDQIITKMIVEENKDKLVLEKENILKVDILLEDEELLKLFDFIEELIEDINETIKEINTTEGSQ